MDFNYSVEDEAFRAEFRAWLERHREFATPARDPMPGRGRRRVGRMHSLASQASRRRLDGNHLAAGIWRARCRPPAKHHLSRRAGAGGHKRAIHRRLRPRIAWAYAHSLGYRRAKAPLSAEDPERRGNLVSGLFRAKFRIRPRAHCKPVRSRTATISSSTDRRSGPLRPITPTGFSCWSNRSRKRRNIRVSATCWLI